MHHALKLFAIDTRRLCESKHALHTRANVLPDPNLRSGLPLGRRLKSVDGIGTGNGARVMWAVAG